MIPVSAAATAAAEAAAATAAKAAAAALPLSLQLGDSLSCPRNRSYTNPVSSKRKR